MQFTQQLQRPGVIALLLAVVTLILLISTAPQIGLTWDEPAYIAAAKSYTTWFGQLFDDPSEALSDSTIDFYWAVNNEHPPMDKVWSGWVWAVAHHFFDDLVAHRLGNMILVSVMVAVLYLWVEKSYGWIAGLSAVGALLAMPRFFFHAHLAALDVPAAFVVFTMTFLFFQWLDKRSWIWTLILGVVFGVAFATKVNALFVLPTLLLWILIFYCQERLFYRLGIASLVGFAVSIFLWPWLYPEVIERFFDYIKFITVDHWEIWQWYLGRLYMPPPWHFPFVILWAVVPLTITILYLIGAVRVIRNRRQDQALGVLFLLSAFIPLLALSIGQSMVYDNDRLFMPAFPFLAALAGIGLAWIVAAIRKFGDQHQKPWFGTVGSVGLVLIVFLPSLVSTVNLYPHLLSYYAQSVGGLRGATRLKLETTYWCETYAEALTYINEHADQGDIIWVQPWSHDVLVYYQLIGKMRPDLKIAAEPYGTSIFGPIVTLQPGASYHDADYILFQYRQSYFGGRLGQDYITPQWLEEHDPVYQIEHQGIPLLQIFKKE
jgi:4-amino-4-deoxy-L-arabinose transferase-like glycosyltransferase